MELKELKECVLDGTLSVDFLIFLSEDSDNYLANQYVDYICENNAFEKNVISSLEEAKQKTDTFSMMFGDVKDSLNILITDTFSDNCQNYGDFENTIVICNKIDKKIAKKVDEYIIKFPKTKDWQVKAHIKAACGNLSQGCIDQLYAVSKGNTYKIDNELAKANLFGDKQEMIITALINDPSSDLYDLQTFTFVDAVLKRDIIKISEAMMHLDQWDSDAMFILTLLINKYKLIELVHGGSNLTAEDIGITPKQYNAIKYYNKGFNLDDVRKKISFLSGINLKINLGKLDLKDRDLLSYILINIL